MNLEKEFMDKNRERYSAAALQLHEVYDDFEVREMEVKAMLLLVKEEYPDAHELHDKLNYHLLRHRQYNQPPVFTEE